ncbi:proline iminopeptidase [Fomitopsis serialis]|uniref:proline iminopeptidase n=1 Tax=Fomitopsis serialis TaxID=139415 RepID=UPI002008D792|nr:proline iminopeptidase [Neoantrodia serialis]KAH9938636.1 proline iminopeptidase [Neoantrodia serialis]
MSITTEGFAPLDVLGAGKPCQTYYKVLGQLTSDKAPIIVLNGGPGSSHGYLLSLADLALPLHGGAPVVFYDQVGGGRSTHLPEKNGDTAFWTVQLFVDEFHNLLKHLGVETYDIVGHSWGAMLGMEIAVRQPKGLRKLVLSSGPTAISLWAENTRKLLKTLPQDVQDTIVKHESDGTFDSPEYQAAIGHYNKQFTLRLDPWPEEVQKCFAEMDEDPSVYLTMQGPSEFTITGSIKTWDIRPELHKISVPVLLTNGAFDGASDAAIAPVFQAVAKAKWVTFARSSHMAHWEEREKYMQLVGDFLQAL